MATILIVDDEKPVRELLALIFAADGHRVVLAGNGRQALELVAQDRPDVVLSDVMMPLLSGAKLCRRLKSDPVTALIPVILMSAAGRAVAARAGADAFVHKPFDLNEIEVLVRGWLPSTPVPETFVNEHG
jgi:two-component system alkaline phosphatase synthesis response regulator PhoP